MLQARSPRFRVEKSQPRMTDDGFVRHLNDAFAAATASKSRQDIDLAVAAARRVMAAPRLQSESVYRTILAVARLLYLSERAYEAVTLTTPLLDAAEQLAQQGEQSLLSSALVHDATMRSEAGDYLSALLRYRRVLAMAYAMKDRRLLIVCVNNIGLTLQYCGLIEASLLTLNEAVRLAADDAHADARASALSNIALGCLRSDDPKRGLPAARAAINTRIPPTQLQVEQQSMIVLAMRDYVRLLLRSGRIAEAREAAERATEAAEKIGMFRPIAAAAVANALVQTYSGQAEQGIQAILDVMNHVEARAETHRDMLETLMEAYTAAGRVERAVGLLEQLHNNLRVRLDAMRLVMDELRDIGIHADIDLESVSTSEGLAARALPVKAGEVMPIKHVVHWAQYERIAAGAELADDETGLHPWRVGVFAGLIARQMGFDDARSRSIEAACRMHDIGKSLLPYPLLSQPRALTPKEMGLMQRHTTEGARILLDADEELFGLAAVIARSHHEWFDGSGYPDGLAGQAIPVEARICAVAEVYDALTHNRPYRSAWSEASAWKEMVRMTGIQFDPEVMQAARYVIDTLGEQHQSVAVALTSLVPSYALSIDSAVRPVRIDQWETLHGPR